jgi:aldehyde:ferredoxin oxidoreductase
MKKLYGWAGTILTVDLSERKISKIPTEEYSDRFIGGIGIGQKLYWDDATADFDAFHPESTMILMTGPLTATPVPSAPRLVVCGRSVSMYPEVFHSASIGGSFAAELKKAGCDGIVVKGKASQPLYLAIEDEKVELKDAGHLWGHTNSKTQQIMREALGEKTKLLTIGPGAEHGSRIGTIATDIESTGSRGFGSKMGSKKLKAIAVKGSGKMAVADQEKINQIKKQIREMKGEGFLNLYEKPFSLPGIKVEKKIHCQGCPQGCWRTLHRSPSGEEGVRKCQTPAFYSLWSNKFPESATEISFRATTLVDDYSLCIIQLTIMLMWLTRCFEEGIVSEEDTELPFSKIGSWEFIEALVKKISYGEGFGKVLAQGYERAARHVGKDAEAIAEDCRAMPYGPKVFTPSAILFATELRPPITELHEVCHPLLKWAIWYISEGAGSYVSTEVLRKIAKMFWGSEKAVDFSTSEGKALAAVKIQNREYAKESLGLCDFAFSIFDNASSEDHVGDSSLESKLLSAVTGKDIDEAALDRIGERIFNLSRAIHLREGKRGKEDDCLPENVFIEREEMHADIFGMYNPELFLPGSGDEIVSRKGKGVDRKQFRQMMDEYYQLRGWDVTTGLLKKETLTKLDLPEVVESLKEKVL